MKVEFFRHNITEADIALASEVMRSIFLTTGPITARFEKKFAAYMDLAEAVGTNSCTGALHLALLRHGIGPGDEVITTPMTFVATVTAIMESGARPVFVDVCPKSGLLLPEKVEAFITAKTKAILPVHLYGRMVDMRGFARLAQEHGLVLIEDAAHCIEGVRDGIRPGQISNAACFSFYATKNMTCGEGGALICRSFEDADWYRSARHHGISRNASSRYTKKYEHWDMEMMGWKYNMDDIQAALLINQIDRLDAYRKRREDLEKLYRELLQGIEGLDFLEVTGAQERSGHHLFTVLLPHRCSRDEILHQLQERGVGCAVNYRAVHTLSYIKTFFGYRPEDYPEANDIGNRTISLPLYPGLTNDEVEHVSTTLMGMLA
jgi:dTDP-4-amino-4,6-dideoxygalactose transaminase